MVRSENKPIAIIGGTYNPVHFGHLRAAIELLEVFDLAEVALMPCYQPVHRAMPSLSVDHRLNMLALATADIPGVSVDTREISRKGPSYSIDSLAEIREESGPQRPIYFAMGVDAFNTIHTWKNWKKLLDFSNLIVMHRPDTQLTHENNPFRQKLRAFHGHGPCFGQLFELSNSELAISSSQIRELTRNKRAIRFLLPEPVRCYIERHQLYQSNL